MVDDCFSRRKLNVLFLEESDVARNSPSSRIVCWSTFLQDHPDSIYMLNILCICRLYWVRKSSFSQRIKSKLYFQGGDKKHVMMRHDCFFISLFSSPLLVILFCFFSRRCTKDFFIHILQFFFFLCCEHVQPEAVLPALNQRCVQVPSLRRTQNNIPPSSSSPSSPLRWQELLV